jgi:glucose/arabinose dehydrogenase
MKRSGVGGLLALPITALLATSLAARPAASAQVEPIASGLDDPRGIALEGDRLLVAETGPGRAARVPHGGKATAGCRAGAAGGW